MSEGNRHPELFDSEEEISADEERMLRELAGALLDADPEFAAWAERRHAEAVKAQDRDESCCFLAREGTEKAN